jgi:eukaryotic-like serine/threonine-protein kinase
LFRLGKRRYRAPDALDTPEKLPVHLSSDPDAIRRFEHEARAISALNDVNICTLYDVGHQDGVDFIVMEYLEGETLQDRLRKGPLPLDEES